MSDTPVSECSADLVAAIVGSICGTLAVSALVCGIIVCVMYRKTQRFKLLYAGMRNSTDQQHSVTGSLEAGMHNSAYIVDNSDSKDLIMMMATRKNGDEKKPSSGRKRVVPSHYKHLESVEVSLIGKEVSGLGFDVQGNPRDGISISNIADRGAAKETNLMKVGDKVISLTISFDNMVYEDALTLLSYASPYPITIQLGRKRKERKGENGTLKKCPTSGSHRKQSSYDSDSGTVSDARSPGLSERQSVNSDEQEVSSPVPSVEDIGFEERTSGEEDTDDDTKRRAPSHLPQTIKSLVESKNAGRQALEVLEGQTKKQILSPTSLESDQGIELSFGAQSALDLILNSETVKPSKDT
ncbi:uncharacterized protein [Watersipora subatra]|uniref:uncharacterized protein isoform X2 n=1 Tax=Watersipora subatra TaxID=2589382 RepID=UPI00355B8ADA